jgi:hypothetical protein
VSANCPWRLDVAPGEFTVERYIALAPCAYDQSLVIFQCHKSTDEKPVACAGFLSRGANHNLAVRMAYSTGRLTFKDRSGGLALHPHFRSLAAANGVEPNDGALRNCRDD